MVESTTAHLREAISLMERQWPDRKDGFARVCLLCETLGSQLLEVPVASKVASDGAPGSFHPDTMLGASTLHALSTNGIFLGGSPKGGTTMFVQLFDGHPQLLTMPGDSKMIDFCRQTPDASLARRILGAQLRQLIAPNAQPPFWNLGESIEPYQYFAHGYKYWFEKIASKRASGGFLAGVLALACVQAYTHGQQKEASIEPCAFVEKTCANVLEPELIYREFSAARIVQIVRDPYTTLAALDRQTKVRNWDWTFEDRLDFVRSILQAAIDNPARYAADRYILVKYEELVANPECVMASLAAKLHIEFDPILCVPTVLGHPAASNSMFTQRRATGTLVSEPIEAGRERYRQAFTTAQQDAVEATVGGLAQKLGYG